MDSVAAMPLEEAHVLRALFNVMLAQADKAGRQDPFALPVAVMAKDLRAWMPEPPPKKLSNVLEKLRLNPVLLSNEKSMLTASDGGAVPVFDIIRAQMYNVSAMRKVWWVRMGQWSQWRLTDADRHFIAQVIVVWLSAPSPELSFAVRYIAARMSEAVPELSFPYALQPVLADLVEGPEVQQLPSGVWLEAIHELEEVGLVACPSDCDSCQKLKKPEDVRTDFVDFYPAAPSRPH
ncbi:MAG: hypothetical protein EP340_07310 [Alphaproteobacteria bacterium]|nr:MAG: hypothetical protein EP340_07310 [Alphaproteobacteria bacterium]